jgi:hypothetical protein
MKTFALLFLAVAASGCPDIKTDPSDESPKGPTVEFDPANKIIPFPNNLLLNPMTGKVALPEQCGETPTAKALREGVLNKLDGFGVYEGALTVTFTEPFDMASIAPNVHIYKIASAGMPVDPASAQKIPVVVQVAKTARFDANCANPAMIDQAIIVPAVPLEGKSTYVVALVDGVKTATGASFVPSFTWSLVRQGENPATFDDNGNYVADNTPLDPNNPAQLEQLKGINLLWNAHAKPMQFLAAKQVASSSVLLAWSFNTQTTTDSLDPTVATSPAAKIVEGVPAAGVPPQFVASLPGPASGGPAGENAEQFLIRRLPAGSCQTGTPAGPIPCQAVQDVMLYAFQSKQYQVDTPNPYTGPMAKPIPGPWSDAIAPTMVKNETIIALVVIPKVAGPWATAVMQHGLGRSNSDALGIASQLAAFNQMATIAIDAVGHGNRAIRVSNAALCADDPASPRADKGPDPTRFPQCYAPFLSPNLAATRDGIRQTVLDLQRLVAGVKACGSAACGTLTVDPAHIVYLGQSLGGIIGSVATAVTSDIKAAVLNVPGAGWVDILENTQELRIRCSLVDGLIDAGILTGEKSNLVAVPPTGLCTTDAWKAQPGYRQFSVIGRWVLDPADPANFTRKLATRHILIQKVEGDTVVPNVATNREGALVGLMEAKADCGLPPAAPPAPPFIPSMALLMNPTQNKFLKYVTVGASDATCPVGNPGNTFTHGSLLSAGTPPTVPGSLATGRMQVDALFFLDTNK